MAHRSNVLSSFGAMDAITPAGTVLAGNPSVAAADASAKGECLTIRREILTLTALRVDVTAANDFGGTLVATFPDSNLLILGFKADLAVTVDGTGIATAATIDVALGNIASTGITAAALDDGDEYIDEYSAIGAGVTGTADAHSNDNATPAIVFYDAGAAADEVWINVEATLSADGWADFTGTIEVFYIDLGEPA